MAIDMADFVVVVLSASSVKSSWVQHELEVAINNEITNRKVKVLPVLKDDCEIPGFLKAKRYADFRSPHRRKLARRLLIQSILDS
jgi:hypothetical protein